MAEETVLIRKCAKLRLTATTALRSSEKKLLENRFHFLPLSAHIVT